MYITTITNQKGKNMKTTKPRRCFIICFLAGLTILIISFSTASFGETVAPMPTIATTMGSFANYSKQYSAMLENLSDSSLVALYQDVGLLMMERGLVEPVELIKGDTGTGVILLQRLLAELDYFDGEPTGKFDAETIKAVKAMEKANNFEQNGEVSIEEQEALLSGQINPKPTPSPSPTPKPTKTPKPTATPYYEPSFALKETAYADWGTSGGYRWAKWEYKNTSKKKTVDGYTLKFYSEDVYGNIQEFNGSKYWTLDIVKTIKPGRIAYSDKIYHGNSTTKRLYCGVLKIHFTDGTTQETSNPNYWYIEY